MEWLEQYQEPSRSMPCLAPLGVCIPRRNFAGHNAGPGAGRPQNFGNAAATTPRLVARLQAALWTRLGDATTRGCSRARRFSPWTSRMRYDKGGALSQFI